MCIPLFKGNSQSYIAATYLSHGCNELHILEHLPVEVLATVVHPSLLKQQFEQGYGLLGAICVYLRHVHIINEHQQTLPWVEGRETLDGDKSIQCLILSLWF